MEVGMKRLAYGTACAAALLLVAGCDLTKADVAPGSGGTVGVEDIAGNPEQYMGQTVSVVADVEEVHSPRAFSLDEDSPAEGGIDNDLLVLSPQAASLSDIDDQWLNNKVRVTGTVGKMSIVEIERELGWDLDPQLEVEVEGAKAVLIAKSVERVQ
jgi:hypothetical protein